MTREQFQAVELLNLYNIKLEDGYEFEDTEYYPIIIKTNDESDTRYYFLYNNGELLYNGWGKNPCIPIMDICKN